MNNLTLAMIKPDGVRRRLVGELISIMERRRFDIMYMRTRQLTLDEARMFYGLQHHGRIYFDELCEFMASGPLVAIVLRAENAIPAWRETMGASSPMQRRPGTIRLAYGLPGAREMENLVHGSDSPESFTHELRSLGIHPGKYL